MLNRIKKVFKAWQAERQRQRFLNMQLEKLTDPTFLDRVAAEE
jgi:hypothetical protein